MTASTTDTKKPELLYGMTNLPESFEQADKDRLLAIIEWAKSAEEVERRKIAKNMALIYKGKFDEVLDSYIENLSEVTEVKKSLKKHLNYTENLLHNIAIEVSQNYKEPPERVFDANQEQWEGIYEDNDLDGLWQEVERKLNGIGANAVYIIPPKVVFTGEGEEERVVAGNGFYKKIITPDLYSVTKDEITDEITAVLYQSGKFWIYFDENLRAKLDDDFQVLKPDEWGFEPEHGYGCIPFVFINADKYADNPADIDRCKDLYNATLKIGLYLTMGDHTKWGAGFKQFAIKGNFKPEEFILWRDSNCFLTLPFDGDIQPLESLDEPEKDETRTNGVIARVGHSRGVSLEEYKLQAQVTSGFSKMLSREKEFDYVKGKQKALKAAEIEFHWKLKLVAGYGDINGELTDVIHDVSNAEVMSEAEKVKLLKEKENAGYTTREDAITEMNPDADDQKIAEIKSQATVNRPPPIMNTNPFKTKI